MHSTTLASSPGLIVLPQLASEEWMSMLLGGIQDRMGQVASSLVPSIYLYLISVVGHAVELASAISLSRSPLPPDQVFKLLKGQIPLCADSEQLRDSPAVVQKDRDPELHRG